LIAPRPAEPELRLVPTGAGLQRNLPTGPIATYQTARFLDAKMVVIGAALKDGRRQVFLQDTEGGPPRELTPPGYWISGRPSSDGKYLTVRDSNKVLYKVDVESGDRVEIAKLALDRTPLKFTEDGTGLIVVKQSFQFPLEVRRFDLTDGTETHEMDIEAPETVGLPMCKWLVMAPVGDTFSYAYDGSPGELYVIENLR
jgi:hypothetical protein